MSDLISRQAAQHKINALIDEFETIMKDIRERHVDDSVCGLCEYDGAFMSDSGNWCNECPGFERDDCFKLKDQYRDEWAAAIKNLPSAQSETCAYWDRESNICALHRPSAQQNLQLTCNQLATDSISRQAAIDALTEYGNGRAVYISVEEAFRRIEQLPSAQPTLYGYNIEHLELIAIVLQKEDLPPERVVEAITDIGRIVAIVRDEFEETLRRALQNMERKTDDLQ